VVNDVSTCTQATEEDAVLAISVYEESLTSRSGMWSILATNMCTLLTSGYSVLNIVPSPHFRDGNTGAYIGQQVVLIDCLNSDKGRSRKEVSSSVHIVLTK